MKKIILIFVCLLSFVATYATNDNVDLQIKYSSEGPTSNDMWWTAQGDGSTWSDAANWSTTDPASTTTAAISPPSSATNTHFTAASFPNAQAYTVNITALSNCLSMDFASLGTATSVTFGGSGDLNVFGNYTLASGMTMNHTGKLVFRSSSIGNTLSFAGNEFKGEISFDGVGGEWTLQDELNFTGSKFGKLDLINGSFKTGNNNISVGIFSSNYTNANRKVDFGTSIITIKNTYFDARGTFDTFSAENATLTFAPSGYLLCTATDSDNSIIFKKITSGTLTTKLSSAIHVTQTELSGDLILYLNASLGTLQMDLGQTIDLGNRVLTIDALTYNNSCESFLVIEAGKVNFTVAPSALSKLWLINVKAYLNNVPASPAIDVTNARDGGLNSNWNITENTSTRDLYWIGNATSSNWFDPTNWSLTSGGAALPATDCYPTILDNVFFDANSFDVDGQFLDMTNNINSKKAASCNNMTWQGLDQINIDWIGTSDLFLGGDLTLDANMLKNINYDKKITLWDGVDGRIDFQSGIENRRMTKAIFYTKNYTTYTQVSDTVHINSMRMNSNTTSYYNLDEKVLRCNGISHGGWLNMKGAHIILDGSMAVYYSIAKLEYNANSHIYVTNSTQFRFSGNWFPSITFYKNFIDNGNLKVDGNLTMHQGALFTGNMIVNDTLFLQPTQIYKFKAVSATTSVNLGAMESVATNCGGGMTLKSDNGNPVRLNIPTDAANITYATISDIDFYPGGLLNVSGGNNIDAGNNTNLDFGGSTSQTFYWRPKQSDGSYTGDWSDPTHWAISATSAYGQTDMNGCIPSAIDNVIFDALSGDGSAATITVADPAQIKNMNWLEGGANDVPAGLKLALNNTFTIGGDVTLSTQMTTSNASSTIIFNSTDTAFIDLKNISFGSYINFSNGIFMVQSPIKGGHVTLNSGILNLNGNDCAFTSFFSQNAINRTFNIEGSILTITSDRNTGTWSGDPKASWNTKVSTNMTLLASNSTVKITSNTPENFFYGGNLTYNKVDFAPSSGDSKTFHHYGNNTYTEGLYVTGASIFDEGFSTKILNLSTNKNNVFPAGDTTHFSAGGNLEKNGDLNQFLNLISSATGNLHYFSKPTGGNMYVCNIAVLDIKAIGVPFKTNDVSTYNGSAGASANPPAGSSWDFDANSSSADIAMIDALDIHANVGDTINVNYLISNNDTGPFEMTYLDEDNNSVTTQVLSSGNPTTNGSMLVGVTNSTNLQITSFKYYDCPGTFLVGVIGDDISLIKVPPVNTGIADDGATEDYLLKNLNSYVYIMDGGDRSNTAAFASRKTQVAINDYTAAGDIDDLGMVTINTSIDANELVSNDGLSMRRHWSFSKTGTGSDAKVKFFFTEAEMQSLKTSANITATDMEFLDMLSISNYTTGNTPATISGTLQQKLSSGIASEVGATTYFIEALVTGFSGNYYLNSPVPCTTVGLALNGATTIGDHTCVKNGWTYYYNNSNPNKAIFAIEHTPAGGNTNTFTADVTISVKENPKMASGIYQVIDATNQEGNFTMGRFWNVNVTSGSLNGPVNVKFYYDAAELAVAQSEANAFANSISPALNVSDPIFFKTIGSAFSPNNMTAMTADNNPVIEFGNLTPMMEDGVTYIQMEGVTSFSGGGVAVRASPAPSPSLPVELTSFTGKINKCKAVLDWTTESEESFSHFELERSTNAVNFQRISSIVAVGGVNIQSYSFTDEQSEGSNYYRLKMVDLDGTEAYSNVIFVQTDCAEINKEVQVFPNPINKNTNQANVRFYTNQQNATITIFDVFGGVSKFIETNTSTGWNTISIDVSDLAPSSYYILLESGSTIYNNAQFLKAY